jgi:Uncharacterized protein conserved in bacteria (DUF2255)
MKKFDIDTLRELHGVREVSIRTEQHPKNAVVIWVVVADNEVFVRSVRGTKGRWYRDLAAGGPATLEFAGRRLPVQASPVSDPAAIARAQPRISEEVPAEPLCAIDGATLSPAHHIAARAALSGPDCIRYYGWYYGWRSKRSTPVRSIDHGRADRHHPCRLGRSSARRSRTPTRKP